MSMKSLKKLESYLREHYYKPFSKKWQGGPGAVVLNAPEEDREDFRQLKSEDVADFVDNQLAACQVMSEADNNRSHFELENKRLKQQFDREIEKHKKFTCN